MVGDEIQRLSALVTEFLDFARPKPLERRPVSLRNLCDHVFQLISPVAEAAKVDLRCEHPASDLQIEVDPAKLEQVLLNLIMNAAQAIPEGNIEGNTIRVAIRTDAKGMVIVEISDTGVGISPEALPLIFLPFYSRRADGHRGTGLGLAICKALVQQRGGRLSASSEPGVGSRFEVELIDADATPAPAPSGAPAAWAWEPPRAWRRPRVGGQGDALRRTSPRRRQDE